DFHVTGVQTCALPILMYKSRLVFIAACLGLLLFGIGLITLGSVATALRDKFDLDEISAGTLFSILPIGILLGSLVFGPLCDKYRSEERRVGKQCRPLR